jgi:hypothetical protein
MRIKKTCVAKKADGKLMHKIGDCLIGRNGEMGTKALLAREAIPKRVMVGEKKRKTGKKDVRKVSEDY